MIKIGIIGTENSHAMAFAKYFNLPCAQTGKVPYDDIRVTAIMGSPESVASIQKTAGVEHVCMSAEEMAQMVDAVMIVNQKGSLHYENAMPFVKLGKPLFVDKPFTSDVAQAKELYAQIQAHGCKVMGGASGKYAPGVIEIRELVRKLRQEGTFVSASMNFIMIMDSEHDGLFFYAPHLVEMAMEAFGTDMKALQAVRNGGSMLVTVLYENDSVCLHFNRDGLQYAAMLYTTKEYYCVDTQIDIFNIYNDYAREADLFAQMLLGKAEPLDEEKMVKPVQIIAAIEESLRTGSMVSFT